MRGLLTVMLLSTGCTGSEERSEPRHTMQRYTNTAEMYSLDAPEGWTASLDRGSTIFTAPGGLKHTVVVRSAPTPLHIIDGNETSKEDVIAATQKALQLLPKGSIERQWTVAGTQLRAEAFSVRFTPPGFAKQYARTHVVVLGKHRVFHVMYTAPIGEKVVEDVLTDMVTGLQEEV